MKRGKGFEPAPPRATTSTTLDDHYYQPEPVAAKGCLNCRSRGIEQECDGRRPCSCCISGFVNRLEETGKRSWFTFFRSPMPVPLLTCAYPDDPLAPYHAPWWRVGRESWLNDLQPRTTRRTSFHSETDDNGRSFHSEPYSGSSWLNGISEAESDDQDPTSAFTPAASGPGSNFPGYDRFTHQVILNELDLTGRVVNLEKYPFDSGGVADIYRAKLKGRHAQGGSAGLFQGLNSVSGRRVAVKIFRRMHFEPETLEQTSKTLYEEARIWRRLDHPNILPFLGISLDLGLSPALVSPLCAAGSIMKHLQHEPRDLVHRLQMVIGVAKGMTYLHSNGIIHGNLCTKKVLVDDDRSPVICGYGMSKAVPQPSSTNSVFSGSIRFSAPESFGLEAGASNTGIRTISGDVYAFAMVALEIFSGLEPYHHLSTEHAVFMHVLRGDRPIRTLDEQAVTTRIWRFLTLLWNQNPSLRPEMPDVVQSLISLRDDGEMDGDDLDFAPNEPAPLIENYETASSGEETSDGSLPSIQGRDLKGRITQDDPYPFTGGGNSNIYRGKLVRSDGRKIRVAIKMIRVSDDGSGQMEEVQRRLRREVDVWSRLKHKNVLRFIGMSVDLAPWPALISPFYKFGHVGTYVRKHPLANRKHLVLGVASGLQYLHSRDIIHGDLKVQNVLVTKRGAPCICDFGISKIISPRGNTMSSVGTAPYMAPELFFVVDGTGQDESPSTTKCSDVYSFALLVLEILTSEPPKGRPAKPIVTAKILQDLRPKREDYDQNQLRPEIGDVLRELYEINFQSDFTDENVMPHHCIK
ncbi:TKL/TKL-ccin protein kinase [Mycena venus]|uniref:TKL/TKL-ccin protein kinase n=1 Tax=Mycena venus TaxID=2733690 RepID=A0A8H6YQ68_9AGAR|nr:TKL/TKL-ccin protein kinase [Mycena venus]